MFPPRAWMAGPFSIKPNPCKEDGLWCIVAANGSMVAHSHRWDDYDPDQPMRGEIAFWMERLNDAHFAILLAIEEGATKRMTEATGQMTVPEAYYAAFIAAASPNTPKEAHHG